MSLTFNPLGKAANLVESMGSEISLAYDDLLFVDHSAYLLQFTDSEQKLYVHFNTDCPEEDREELTHSLQKAAELTDMQIELKGTFSLEQLENDELEVTFMQ